MSTQGTILIVDDDVKICELLAEFFHKHGYQTIVIHDGKQLYQLLLQKNIDIVLLDIMLPGENGISLCKKIREKFSIPVIMLTAVEDDVEQVVSLEIGADNYITKPFNARILLAYVKSLLRRHELSQKKPESALRTNHFVYQFCDWKLNTQNQQLISPEHIDISLSTAEYKLLLAFLTHPNQVLNRDQLLELTAGRFSGPFDRTVDVLVNFLRKKLNDNYRKPKFIKTVHNSGYTFIAAVIKLAI